jgi:phage tail sheath protein FI
MAPDEFTHSALESLNVRLVANCVKKQIFTTCMKLTFEPNNSRLWLTFYDAMDKYLSFMKRNGGLYDYKIEMNESTVTTDDINELRCPGKVWINPTRTAEFFDIDFIITDAGVTFTED